MPSRRSRRGREGRVGLGVTPRRARRIGRPSWRGYLLVPPRETPDTFRTSGKGPEAAQRAVRDLVVLSEGRERAGGPAGGAGGVWRSFMSAGRGWESPPVGLGGKGGLPGGALFWAFLGGLLTHSSLL